MSARTKRPDLRRGCMAAVYQLRTRKVSSSRALEGDDLGVAGCHARALLVDGGVGKAHMHRGADAERGFDRRLAAMHRGERLDERETQARALLRAHMLAFDLLEGPAQALEILGRDADAGIADRDLDAARVEPGGHAHLA